MQSPPGRRPRQAGRRSAEGRQQWLDLPAWRQPLDALLVLAVTFSVAWVGLVVIPAAAHGDRVRADARQAETSVTDPTPDPSQWFAGPVYTGGPAAPTTTAPTGADVVADVVVQSGRPAPRALAKQTSSRTTAPRTTAPRTTAPRTTAPRTTAALEAATTLTTAPTTTATPVTTDPTTTVPTTTDPTTTDPTTTSSASETTATTSSSTETTSTETSTTTPPATTTTSASPGG